MGESGFASPCVSGKRGGRGAVGFLKDIHCAFSISSLVIVSPYLECGKDNPYCFTRASKACMFSSASIFLGLGFLTTFVILAGCFSSRSNQFENVLLLPKSLRRASDIALAALVSPVSKPYVIKVLTC